jgi:hypothetical protein
VDTRERPVEAATPSSIALDLMDLATDPDERVIRSVLRRRPLRVREYQDVGADGLGPVRWHEGK